MALKGKPIPISTAATTIYTCPAGTEASVHGLIFSNNTGGALSVNVLVFNQADNTTVTVATGLIVPANQFITWTKPINLAAADSIQAVSSAATGIVCLFSVFEGSAAPVAIGFTGRGEWSNVSSYLVNDIATVTGSGTFLALAESTNQDPTSNTAAWMFLEGISASALPPQSGQDGKFLTTDGTDASWAEVDVSGGAEIVDPMSTNITLTSANKRVQVLSPDADIREVTLPVAGTLTLGESFLIQNKSSFKIIVKNDSGQILLLIPGLSSAKFLLVDTATTDWEAYLVEMSGGIATFSTTPSPQWSMDLGPSGAKNPTIRKLGTNKYSVVHSSFQPNTHRNRFEIFTLDADGNYAGIRTGDHNRYSSGGSIGNTGAQYLNAYAFLDDSTIMAGQVGDWGQNPSRVSLFEFSETQSLEQRHQGPALAQPAAFPTVARMSNRKGIVALTKSDGAAANVPPIELQVINYSSSLTAPTVGSKSNVAPGGTHNSVLSDIDRLEDDKGILMFNARTGNTGNSFEKRVLAFSVSGTTITTGSSIALSNTNVVGSTVKIRGIDATTAIAAWTSGLNTIARVVKISGTTVTAGPEFTLSTPPFGAPGLSISQGDEANTFFATTQNGADNNCTYLSKCIISGTDVTVGPFNKLSAFFGSNPASSSTVFYDSERDRLVTVFPGAGLLNFAVSTTTVI